VSGEREREPPSEIQFALNIASIVRFVKGRGLLHGCGDDGGSAEAFSETWDQIPMGGCFGIEREADGWG
jgi:hypothetical protein